MRGALKARHLVTRGPKTYLLILKAISLKRPMDAALLKGRSIVLGFKTRFTLYFSLFSANSPMETGSINDCHRHQAVPSLQRFPDGARMATETAGLSCSRSVSVNAQLPLGGIFGPVSLVLKKHVSRKRRLLVPETRFECDIPLAKRRRMMIRCSSRSARLQRFLFA
jgi:hypothetical protein